MVHRIPEATYRLQLHADFTLENAAQIVPYLARLGITDLYLSPIMRARAGSQHGYDVTDPTEINPAIGGDAGFDLLIDATKSDDLGILVDIVPNHMAAHIENPWWLDVLRHGVDSEYARFFDIDWSGSRDGLRDRVLLPVLGKHYVDALNDNEIHLLAEQDGHWIAYYDWRFPVSPDLRSRNALELYLRSDHEAGQRVLALDHLLAAQAYQLAYWRSANQEINYRRFFDINDLAAMRVEFPLAFDQIHSKISELVESGLVTGLRIDHVDGLWNPEAYLQRLQAEMGDNQDGDFYVVVEKILSGAEQLADTWPVAGTTGYDFLNMVNGALTEGQNSGAIDRLFQRLTDDEQSFHDLVYTEKLNVITNLFQADLQRIARKFIAVADRDRYGRDLTRADILRGISELTACLPVYRTYTQAARVSEADQETMDRAVREASHRAPDLVPVFRFLTRVILFRNIDEIDETDLQGQVDAVMSWQQFTGPVMAKGLEDTSLYVDTRLVSLNAVGGEPDVIEVTVDNLHEWAGTRASRWPHSMNASSTHDSKRSEDVRARISVLSQIPDLWEEHVELWMAWNARLKTMVDESAAPEPRTELLLYQSLLGAWPIEDLEQADLTGRMQRYMIKATREAKRWTSWTDQNTEYEDALEQFIEDILNPDLSEHFLPDFQNFQEIVAFHGALNSLSQTVLKYTFPGVPDLYQGCELWDLSLVDPDNRRPVDFEHRAETLDRIVSLEPGEASSLLPSWRDGAIKMLFIHRLLTLRKQHRDTFTSGGYRALRGRGEYERHIIAFARTGDNQVPIVVVVPRLTATLARASGLGWDDLPIGSGVWGNTSLELPYLSNGRWRNILADDVVDMQDQALSLGDVFERVPFAVLIPD